MSRNLPAIRAAPEGKRRDSILIKRTLPLAALATIATLLFWFDLDRFLTFEALQTHHRDLTGFVADQGALAIAAFLTIYAIATAVSLPGGAVMSIAGGFLFGSAFGTLYIVLAATLGATAVFLIARTAFGDALRSRAGSALQKMEAGFKANAFSYLLTLRLIPLFPFVLVNLVPAFLGVSLRTYVVATVIGIVPGAFVFASAGAGLGSVLDTAESLSPGAVLTPEVVIAFTGLGLLSLLPVLYKRLAPARAGRR
jgi:uncharacterized membrane protein YdjX (TVP38/TMEM64 family)